MPYSRNGRDHPYDDRTTGAAAHSRAEESVAVGETKLQDAGRDAIDYVRPGRRIPDVGASEWYRCLGCRVSDGVEDSGGETRIS